MIWGTHMYTSGALGPDQDVAREVLSPVSCCCHSGEGAEPWLEVEKTMVLALPNVDGTLLSFAPFAEFTVTLVPGDTQTQLPTQLTRPPNKLLSLKLWSCSLLRR